MIVRALEKLRTHPNSKLPPGTNRCLCASCGVYFGGVTSYAMHRVGPADDRSCLAPGDVRDNQLRPLLKLNKFGYWVRIDHPGQRQQPIVRVAA